MGFEKLERRGIKIPEGADAVKTLTDENRVQDAQIGLLEWEIEERNKQYAAEIAESKRENGVDHLTGAASRRTFDQVLAQSLHMIHGEIKEKRKNEEQLREFALILIDIDHFKRINDTLGHHAGDEVLKRIAGILTQSVRDIDLVARWGGEEFFVLLRGADIRVATQKAEGLRAAIEQLEFAEYPEMHVTASFGVVSSEASSDARTLETQADKALYKAKHSGRNRVVTQGDL